MLSRFAFCVTILALTLLVGGLSLAQEAEERPPFILESPLLIKADWESALLQAGDFNGDGRIDFVTVNNAKNFLQLYSRQEDPDASKVFEKKEEALRDPVSSMVAADFNGDGKKDLALSAPSGKTWLRIQQPDGRLNEDLSLDWQSLFLESDDLDKDGAADLVGLTQDRVTVAYGPLTDRAGKKTLLSGAASATTTALQVFFNGSSAAGKPLLADVDGNGLADILYQDGLRRSRMLVRLQEKPRQWGLEFGVEINESAGFAVWRSPGFESQAEVARLGVIDSKTREIRLYGFRSGSTEETVPFRMAGPYYLSFESRGLTGRENIAVADLQGNGRTDLLIASNQAAEISLYLQTEDGRLSQRTAPSLSDIAAIRTVSRPEGDLVFTLSKREETIGVSEWEPERALTVPNLLDSPLKPLAIATADLDGSGKSDLLYLVREQEGEVRLAAFLDPSDVNLFTEGPGKEISLPESENLETEELIAADLNGDKRCDLAVFGLYNPLAIYLQNEDGTFRSYSTQQGMRRGIFGGLKPAQVAIVDLENDGHNEILIARETFARAYRIDSEGNLQLIEQFNGRNAQSRISSVAAGDLDGSGEKEVVLLDTGSQTLSVFTRAETGEFGLARHQELQGLRASRLMSFDADSDGRADLLAWEEDHPQVFWSQKTGLTVDPLWRQAPEEREGKYARIEGVNLIPEEVSAGSELIAIEGTEHLMELFKMTYDESGLGRPERLFSFKIFDDERSISRSRDLAGRQDPRDILAADVDGDGILDLVVLMHDNIGCYLQKKK